MRDSAIFQDGSKNTIKYKVMEKMIKQNEGLYRYMSFKRFIQILFSGQIAAMNPSQWPDQYELYWLKCLQSEKGKKEFDDYIKGLNNDKINKEWTKKSATELCDLTYKKCYAI